MGKTKQDIHGKLISSVALEQRTYSLVGRFSGPRDELCTASGWSSSLSLSLSPLNLPVRRRFFAMRFPVGWPVNRGPFAEEPAVEGPAAAEGYP